jgi:4-hydroxy 2-oxovalerate aldolase
VNLIDVTLRDGGHQVNFDWPEDFVRDYLSAVRGSREISYVELGYWGQTAKSKNRFYCLGKNDLRNFETSLTGGEASIMIDYHYCSHELQQYPRRDDFPFVGLIRLCSRREDVGDAVKFGRELKAYTGLKLSLNFFNITNYSTSEIREAVNLGTDARADFIYFADTHGALDLSKEGKKYRDFADMILDSGITPGLHLHDHSGKALLNFTLGREMGFGSFDCSLGGMGKGAGNLKMEHVLPVGQSMEILNMLTTYSELLSMPELPHALVTAEFSATDYYALQAKDLGMSLADLSAVLSTMSPTQRDVFHSGYLRKNIEP